MVEAERALMEGKRGGVEPDGQELPEWLSYSTVGSSLLAEPFIKRNRASIADLAR
jgi:hypothetical protein